MKLAKSDYVVHSLELPISKKLVSFRPWNMKEHKILLMAYAGADKLEIRRAIKQILTNIVIDDLDVSKLPMAEAELLFINARAKSVGEKVDINLENARSRENKKVSVDLTEVKIQIEKDRKLKIELEDGNGKPTGDVFLMREPTLGDSEMILMMLKQDNTLNEDLELATLCVERVCSQDESVEGGEERAQIKEYIESMTPRQYLAIDSFLDGVPRIKHEIELSTVFEGAKGKYTLEGLDAFF